MIMNDDTISRRAAIEAICHNCTEKETCDGTCYDTDVIRELPSAEKHGQWVKSVSPMVDMEECSVCGFQINTTELESPYCPWCGARMNG